MNIQLISFFSGSGGLDLGFEQAGFVPIIAYDNKQSAINTYNHNRENKVAQLRNIADLTALDIIQDIKAQNKKANPRGVIGGPPCQYYSAGNSTQRREDDIRRYLPVKYAELLKELNQHYDLDFFLFENVNGLTHPSHRNDLNTLLKLFAEAGFHVSWQVLDAANFDVPQKRERIFIIGWNNNRYQANSYSFPEGVNKGKTVYTILKHLPEPVYYRKNLQPKDFPYHPNHWTMQPKSKKFKDQPSENSHNSRSFRRLKWHEPSPVVAYGHLEIHVHPLGHRRLSIYEAMLLQGFPSKGYRFIGNLSEQCSLVSDAVPPPLGKVLGQSICDHLDKNY